MSGGALDYLCFKMTDHITEIPDIEIRDLMIDLSELMHDLEWYLSGDTAEGSWLQSLDVFRKKWLRRDSEERIIEYAKQLCTETTDAIMDLVGLSNHCKDCAHFTERSERYGDCSIEENHALRHKFSRICENFKKNDGVSGYLREQVMKIMASQEDDGK